MGNFRLTVSYKKRICKFCRPALPPWLTTLVKKDWSDPKYVSQRYWLKIYWSTPPWLSEQHQEEMRKIYNSSGPGQHVDHIVPLNCPGNVCGLNVPWNLEVISQKENLQKSCLHWPDSPHEIHSLDLGPVEPHQTALHF